MPSEMPAWHAELPGDMSGSGFVMRLGRLLNPGVADMPAAHGTCKHIRRWGCVPRHGHGAMQDGIFPQGHTGEAY
jgi:hypothetical protein